MQTFKSEKDITRASCQSSSAIARLRDSLSSKLKIPQGSQLSTIVSHCWTRACAFGEDSKLQAPHEQQPPFVSHCWTRALCWQRSLKAPDPTKTCNLLSSAIARLRHVRVERPKEKSAKRQRQQPAYQLAREQRGEHQGAGLCLAVIEGRAHKYSANAIYRSIHTDTSIVASMGQIGHDCQRAARRRPNSIDTFAVLRVMNRV
jgi:hypothetical protein